MNLLLNINFPSIQAQIPAVDYYLLRVCEDEIKEICLKHNKIEVCSSMALNDKMAM